MPTTPEERAAQRRQVQAEYRAHIRAAEEERKAALRERILAYARRLPPPFGHFRRGGDAALEIGARHGGRGGRPQPVPD